MRESILADKSLDFVAKMSIALKEANESSYWLKLLHRTDYLNQMQYESLNKDVQELIGLLMATCKTANQNK